jgi:hypothetical protein
VNRRLTGEKDTSINESGVESNNIREDMSQTENNDQEKSNLTKMDPLSIRESKRETLKNARRQDPDFLCDEDCNFRGKEVACGPGVLGSESEEAADSDELEAERRMSGRGD